MNPITVQSTVVKSVCFVAITMDGHQIFLRAEPKKRSCLIIESDEAPFDSAELLLKDAEYSCANKSNYNDADSPPKQLEPYEYSVMDTLVGATKIAQAHLGIGASSVELEEKRKRICLSCEHFDFGRCNSCGCVLYAKVKIRGEHCPIKKW